MLASGNPPDDWAALVKASRELPQDVLPSMSGVPQSEG
jgi:hypothetical protein